MKKWALFLAIAWIQFNLSAQQNVSNFTATLNSAGNTDGVAFILQGQKETTLTVPVPLTPGASDINLHKNAVGVSTSDPGLGIINFQGNSDVFGTVGAANALDTLEHDPNFSPTVTFHGTVNTTSVLCGSGSFVFEDLTTASDFSFFKTGSIEFQANATGEIDFDGVEGLVKVDSGVTYTGNATTTIANTGQLALLGPCTFDGNVGTQTLPIDVIRLNNVASVGIATVNGDVAAKNFGDLGVNTLGINGDLFFSSSPSITLQALGDNIHGQILVSGSGNFANGTDTVKVNVLVEPTSSNFFSGNPIKIVSAGNGGNETTGHPVNVTSNLPRIQFTGNNPVGSANIFITPFIAPAPVSGPGIGAARTIEAIALGATGDLAVVEAALNSLPTLADVAAAESQMAPIVNGDIVNSHFDLTREFQNNWAMSLVRARSANICYNPSHLGYLLCGCENDCTFGDERSWAGEGIWFQTFGYFPDQKSRHGILGYESDQYGVMVALQRGLCDNLQLGIGGGYGFTKIHQKCPNNFNFSRNHARINTGEVTLYLGYSPGCWFLDSFLTGTWSDVETHRRIRFTDFNRRADAKFDAREFAFYVQTGFNYWPNYFGESLTLTPLASLEYIHLHIDGFNEHGAGAIDLFQRAQHYHTLQSGLGLMLGYSLDTCFGPLFLEVHSKWLYNLNDYHIRNRSAFEGAPDVEFTTNGLRSIRSAADIGLSASLFTFCNWAFELGYDYYSQDDYTAEEYLVTAIYRF